MELTHDFTVPAGLEQTWAEFTDIAGVAGCFPGATVSGVEGDAFEGSVKVKLGPIALVYNGAGTITEKDEAAGRLLISARGKDKRGNGTASAEVTVTMTGQASRTEVHVVTALQITGKPAQFGRSVMQDVSDRLLEQFIACLSDKLAGPPATPAEEPMAQARADQEAAAPEPAPVAGRVTTAGSEQARAPRPQPSPATALSGDAIDLRTTVLPVLVRTYRRQVAAAVVVLLVIWAWRRRR
ncbi:MAG TPA: SRPBCC family protein [Marmoricola sp.]|nr:SRPBCC family protein [Marmoricola sp.]